jgi:hypothetical protein
MTWETCSRHVGAPERARLDTEISCAEHFRSCLLVYHCETCRFFVRAPLPALALTLLDLFLLQSVADSDLPRSAFDVLPF